MKILEIDDNIDLANCIAQLLEAENHQVTLAYTGEEALTQIDTDVFDLILLDAKLPDVTGFELLNSIYQLNADQNVIMVTGYRIDQLLAQAAPADEHAILTRTIHLNDIADSIIQQPRAGLLIIPVERDLAIESIITAIQPACIKLKQLHTIDDITAIEENETILYYAEKPLSFAIYLLAEIRKQKDNRVIIFFPYEANKTINYKEYDYTGCIFKPFDPEHLLGLIK